MMNATSFVPWTDSRRWFAFLKGGCPAAQRTDLKKLPISTHVDVQPNQALPYHDQPEGAGDERGRVLAAGSTGYSRRPHRLKDILIRPSHQP